MPYKEEIINRFINNIKGRKSETDDSNPRHCGREGHWLETQMGIAHNGNTAPDLFGYEMKNQTTSGKISFGDWSANEYIFLHGRTNKGINSINNEFRISRNEFLDIFGKPNPLKNDRPSWSGTPCPSYYNQTSLFGQKLVIDNNGNILIIYNFSQDSRPNKNSIVPINMQREQLILAIWEKVSIKTKLEKKFNQRGWFTCTKNQDGYYENIHFGKPMNFNTWIELFERRIVFFDSGMYKGNIRPYSMWRANTVFWHSLIIESY
jgi:hypothetical protein